MTSLPLWAVYTVSLGVPLLAFAGAMTGQFITRRAASELETRSKREEVMRNLRWAAELAVSGDEAHARLGVAQLKALGESSLPDQSQQLFIDAALAAVVNIPAKEIARLPENAEVVATLWGGTAITRAVATGSFGVPSRLESAEEGGGE